MSAPGELPQPASTEPSTQATELIAQALPTSPVPTEAVAVSGASRSRLTELRGVALRTWSRLTAELERLPPGGRRLVVGSLLIGAGAAVALVASRGGRAPDEELERWARRIAAPEGELVRSALASGDALSALAVLRSSAAKDRLRADPAALAVRARLALGAREPSDALDSLELAITEHPKLVKEAWVAESIIQTFNAGRPARTGLLLARVARTTSVGLLRTASADWSWRVRHGAADALNQLGEAPPDPVGFLIFDAWQTDRCDVQRAAVAKLRAPGVTDERIPAALEALARRPGLQGCIDDLLPRAPR